MRSSKNKRNTGSDLVRALCDYLALRKHFFWRNNNQPTYDSARKMYRAMPLHALKGTPDIILIDDTGHFIGIEAKSGKGRLSPEQKAFAQKCKDNGAEFIEARSIDDLVEAGL